MGDVAGGACRLVFCCCQLAVAVVEFAHDGGVGVVEDVECECHGGAGVFQFRGINDAMRYALERTLGWSSSLINEAVGFVIYS